MRLGVVTTSYPRYPGDLAGAFVGEHVDWLRRAGYQVEVVAADHPEAVPLPGVTRVPAPPGLFYDGGAPEALGARPELKTAALGFTARMLAALRHRRWDGAIGHWLVPSMAAALALPRVPLVAIAHSGDVDLLCKMHLAGPVAALLRARRARLIFVAQHLRERFADACPALLRKQVRAAAVVPMGVEVSRLANVDAVRERRRVVFLGRLVDIKGARVLVEAMEELARESELVIAGRGPMEEAIARRAKEVGARFVGFVGGADRDRLLASAAVVIIPSVPVAERREGFPVTALEAMAAGAAVVASRTGGLAELPADAVALVPPGDPQALVAAVRELLGPGPGRARQVVAAQAYVESLDWGHVGPQLVP